MSNFQKAMNLAWSVVGKADQKRISKQNEPAGVKVIENIRYSEGDDPMHLLNIYLPERFSEEKLPCIIDIHGGGWMYGDKDLNKYYCMYLASKNYAVMGMSYRLFPHTDLKGMVKDIFMSLNWLYENADEYNFDLDHVMLTGDSAGGHLTGLVASIMESPKLQALYDVTVPNFKFCMLTISHGALDLYFDGYPKFMKNAMQQLVFSENPSASPYFGNASFEETTKDIPLPFIMFITSEADPLHKQTLKAIEYLKSRKADCHLKFWTKSEGRKLSHVFHISHYEWIESRESSNEMLRIFENIIANSYVHEH